MSIAAVIFDCDGVMFESRQANINFYNHLLSHFGLPGLKDDDVEFVHMHTAEESVNHIFRKSPYVAAAQEYRTQGVDHTIFIRDMVMEPGLTVVLDYLKPRCGLAVATNRSITIGNVLTLYGLKHYFDIVVSSLDVKNPKPHPEPIFKVLDFFGLSADQCVFVGDSEVDGEACRASDVPFIAYRNKGLSADYYIDDLREILKRVSL